MAKVGEVFIELHRSNVVRLMKLAVDGGDSGDTGGGILQLRLRCACCSGLQMQKARHDLQTVLDAMIDLLQQKVFLPVLQLERMFCIFEFLSLVEVTQ